LESAGKTVSYDEMQPGNLIFYSFTNNGRYKNISHGDKNIIQEKRQD
jgi:cell wall-associated NlpC family hydrolase